MAGAFFGTFFALLQRKYIREGQSAHKKESGKQSESKVKWKTLAVLRHESKRLAPVKTNKKSRPLPYLYFMIKTIRTLVMAALLGSLTATAQTTTPEKQFLKHVQTDELGKACYDPQKQIIGYHHPKRPGQNVNHHNLGRARQPPPEYLFKNAPHRAARMRILWHAP